jgi:hypothetical protein
MQRKNTNFDNKGGYFSSLGNRSTCRSTYKSNATYDDTNTSYKDDDKDNDGYKIVGKSKGKTTYTDNNYQKSYNDNGVYNKSYNNKDTYSGAKTYNKNYDSDGSKSYYKNYKTYDGDVSKPYNKKDYGNKNYDKKDYGNKNYSKNKNYDTEGTDDRSYTNINVVAKNTTNDTKDIDESTPSYTIKSVINSTIHKRPEYYGRYIDEDNAMLLYDHSYSDPNNQSKIFLITNKEAHQNEHYRADPGDVIYVEFRNNDDVDTFKEFDRETDTFYTSLKILNSSDIHKVCESLYRIIKRSKTTICIVDPNNNNVTKNLYFYVLIVILLLRITNNDTRLLYNDDTESKTNISSAWTKDYITTIFNIVDELIFISFMVHVYKDLRDFYQKIISNDKDHFKYINLIRSYKLPIRVFITGDEVSVADMKDIIDMNISKIPPLSKIYISDKRGVSKDVLSVLTKKRCYQVKILAEDMLQTIHQRYTDNNLYRFDKMLFFYVDVRKLFASANPDKKYADVLMKLVDEDNVHLIDQHNVQKYTYVKNTLLKNAL